MKEALREFCKSIGIESMGIAPIGPYVELEQILKERISQGRFTEFEEQDLQLRVNPQLTMENVKSIIVCLFPYYLGEKVAANVAKYTYSVDYHRIIRGKLEEVGGFLEKKIAGFEYKAYVDNGPLVDRYLAYIAGLGFYGLNSHIITDAYGSYFFIGYMLTNYPFETDIPLERTCMLCGECKKVCPGSSILDDNGIDPRTCRSYLTQKKGELTGPEIDVIKKTNLVFGCDNCQEACPHNAGIALSNIAEFQEDRMEELSYNELAGISNKEFMRRYGNRAFSWRGRKLLIRNFEYLRNS